MTLADVDQEAEALRRAFALIRATVDDDQVGANAAGVGITSPTDASWFALALAEIAAGLVLSVSRQTGTAPGAILDRMAAEV